jgi:UDP-N-acetylmuramoylalanine--D-glutamate ligase
MCPQISWSELTDASVGLWGLGVEGAASLRLLQSMGTVPVLVDDHPRSARHDGLKVLTTERGGLQALLGCDVVIKSPGISRYRPEVIALESAGVAVRGGLGLWLEEVDRQKVACITGTKGKSTTTAIAVHLLHGLGYSAQAGGNIGRPPWDPSPAPSPEYWIIETSSFQVPDLTVAPPTVAVTSLSPDHLDWHGSIERYYADKLSLGTKPGVRSRLADSADPQLREHNSLFGSDIHWVQDDEDAWTDVLKLPGRHNARNASMARHILVAMGVEEARSLEQIAVAAEGFAGLPSRCRSLGSINGVEFVDDSLSTNVLPVRAALEAFADRPVALLVGGHDRGLDYSPLGLALAERELPTLVVTMPDNGPRIGQTIRDVAGDSVELVDAPDLDTAVATAFSWAEPGAVVLLSPAAPSFGHFVDYSDRAQAFAAAAAACGTLS